MNVYCEEKPTKNVDSVVDLGCEQHQDDVGQAEEADYGSDTEADGEQLAEDYGEDAGVAGEEEIPGVVVRDGDGWEAGVLPDD